METSVTYNTFKEEHVSVNSRHSLIPPPGSCWYKVARSNRLVVTATFIAMVTGIMVVSVLQPILPDLLDVMYRDHYAPRPSVAPTADTIIGQNDTNNVTFPEKSLIIGSLLGFAPLVEIFFTPVAVLAIKRLGFKLPMLIACLLQMAGCYAIAFANTLLLLYTARIMQAVSVIFATVAGFSMVAIRFRNDDERSNALATIMHGFPIGILIAYPCGTAIYSYFGVVMPFVITSGLSVVCTVLVMLIDETDEDKLGREKDEQSAGYCVLLSDKAIMLSLLLIAYSWGIVFLLGATTPNRMSTVFKAESWQIGLVLFVSTLCQVLTSAAVGRLAGRVDRWTVALIGNIFCTVGLVTYHWCTTIYHAIGPEVAVRVGWGLVTASMGPLLATLVDQAQGFAYIRVYALFMSFNLFGCFAGSLLGGWLEGILGFDTLYWDCAILTFVLALLGYAVSHCLKERSEEEILESVNESEEEYYRLLATTIGSNYTFRNLGLV